MCVHWLNLSFVVLMVSKGTSGDSIQITRISVIICKVVYSIRIYETNPFKHIIILWCGCH